MLIYITYSGITVLAVFHGMGQHINLVSLANKVYVFKVWSSPFS